MIISVEEKALDPESEEYLNIPLVVSTDGVTVHTDIRMSHAYERTKETRKVKAEIKADLRPPAAPAQQTKQAQHPIQPTQRDQQPTQQTHHVQQPTQHIQQLRQQQSFHGYQVAQRTHDQGIRRQLVSDPELPEIVLRQRPAAAPHSAHYTEPRQNLQAPEQPNTRHRPANLQGIAGPRPVVAAIQRRQQPNTEDYHQIDHNATQHRQIDRAEGHHDHTHRADVSRRPVEYNPRPAQRNASRHPVEYNVHTIAQHPPGVAHLAPAGLPAAPILLAPLPRAVTHAEHPRRQVQHVAPPAVVHPVQRRHMGAIPPSSFYATIAAPDSRPPAPNRRIPPTQSVVPAAHRRPVNEASARLVQALRDEEHIPLRVHRQDIQLSRLTRSFLAGRGGLPAPLLISRRTITTPSSPTPARRSTVQFSDDIQMRDDSQDAAYHEALQAAEFDGAFEDDYSGAGDLDEVDVFGVVEAPYDEFYKRRAYREGMDGPSNEVFISPEEELRIARKGKARRDY